MLKYRALLSLIAIEALIGAGLTFYSPILAQSVAKANRSTPKAIFKPPASNRKPERTIGAGVRNGTTCRKNTTMTPVAEPSPAQQPLMALVPAPMAGGLTLAERPSFWVYLPETNAKQVVLSLKEVSLKEEGMKFHSQTFFPVQSTPRLQRLTIPPNVPPLALDKTYQVGVVLVCGKRPGPNDPMITAWVQRVEHPDALKKGTLLEQAAWYGEQGIWYDALSALAQSQQLSPADQNLKGIWADFLRSGGLEPISMDVVRSYSVASP